MYEQLFTTAEVADLFRVSVQTVRVWRLSGRLRGVRIGKGLRFLRRDIERALGAPLVLSRSEDEFADAERARLVAAV